MTKEQRITHTVEVILERYEFLNSGKRLLYRENDSTKWQERGEIAIEISAEKLYTGFYNRDIAEIKNRIKKQSKRTRS